MNTNSTKNNFYTYEELIKRYVDEKFQLVEYELILDSLFMAKIKDEDWREKKKIAEKLYAETEELIEFLSCLLEKESNNKEKALA